MPSRSPPSTLRLVNISIHVGAEKTGRCISASASWATEKDVPAQQEERGYIRLMRPTEAEARAAILAYLATLGVPVPPETTVDRYEERDKPSEDPELSFLQRIWKLAPLGPRIRVLPLDYPIPVCKDALPPFKAWESPTGDRRGRHTSGPPRGGHNAFRFGRQKALRSKQSANGQLPAADLSEALDALGIEGGEEADCE